MDMTPVTRDNNPDISKKLKSNRKSYKMEYTLKVIEEYKKTNNYYALVITMRRPCLLILDKLKAQKTEMVLNHMKINNIQQLFIHP